MRLVPFICTSLLALAFGEPAQAQCPPDQLLASDAAAGDGFGEGVAISGEVAIVGAGDEDEGIGGAGSAYVFRQVAGVWTEEQKLTRPTPASNYHFGFAVAIDGDVAVCGVPGDDDFATLAGSADVFRHNGSSWVHEQRLAASDQAGLDSFGFAVDVQGSVIVVGAMLDDDGQLDAGSAYVFRHNGASWLEEQKITASDPAQYAQFGYAVAIDGELIVVGARQDDDGGVFSGGAYVFRHNGASWLEEQKLNASDEDEFHFFGLSVGVSGDVVVCGAHEADVGAFTSGAAYVFRHNAGSWSEEQVLSASDVDGSDQFGWSCDVSGSTIVVGSRHDAAPDAFSGSVYVYTEDGGGGWDEIDKLEPASGAAGGQMGFAVAIDEDRVIAGATRTTTGAGSAAGAAYIGEVAGECSLGTAFCFCEAGSAPCGNGGAADEGCQSSTGVGARLLAWGSTSVVAEDLVLTGTQLPSTPGLYFQGTIQVNGGAGILFGDGYRCAGGTVVRLGPVVASGGTSSYPSGAQTAVAVRGGVSPGDTRTYQLWYRDGSGPCSSGFNTTHGLSIEWGP